MNEKDRKTRAKVAALTRHHPGADETIELTRDFKKDRLAEHIHRVVSAAPALTDRQRRELAAVLRGSK